MADFFKNIEYGAATELDRLSLLIYELRENRNAVLAPYGAADEAALLRQIEAAAVAEHPAYEHYLAARILAATRETARELAGECLMEASRT